MPRLRWILIATVGAVAAAMFATACSYEAERIARLGRIVEQKRDEIVRLDREVQRLQRKIRYYRTREGVARLAREQFNMVFPDERIFRILSEDPEGAHVLPAAEP
ncbi:MAG: septum formation initiator family protein [Synergistales bacterium]|nr:septum formation initiator family protein [Synergistales bacterium]